MPEEVDDELEEEGVLDSPLDKLEPYGMFKNALMCKSCITLFLNFTMLS